MGKCVDTDHQTAAVKERSDDLSLHCCLRPVCSISKAYDGSFIASVRQF